MHAQHEFNGDKKLESHLRDACVVYDVAGLTDSARAHFTHGCYPVRWVRLDELVHIQRSNSLLSKKNFAPEGLPYIQYGQIHTGKFLTQDDYYLTYIDPADCSSTTKTVQAGDLLLTAVSEDREGLGRPLLWQGAEAVISQSLFLLKFRTPAYAEPTLTVDRLYLAYFFQSQSFQLQKHGLVNGVTVYNISLEQLARIQIPLPPLEVQREMGEFLWSQEQLLFSREAGLIQELELRQQQLRYFTQLFFA